MSQTFQIQFFALLREQAGCRELSLESEADTPAALYRELAGSHGLSVPEEILSFAVNESYVAGDSPLADGDRIAFIPPVAGG
ncbi:MAG: molybdopterin converting factor subunit 1 [Puniceicoccales bacterium]